MQSYIPQEKKRQVTTNYLLTKYSINITSEAKLEQSENSECIHLFFVFFSIFQ